MELVFPPPPPGSSGASAIKIKKLSPISGDFLGLFKVCSMSLSTHIPLDREHEKTAFAFQTGKVGEEAKRLTDQFARHASRPGAQIHLDFGNVEYVVSEDLGAIVGLHNKVRGAGGHLTLLNVRPKVSAVIAITRLDTLMSVHRIG